MFGTDIAGGAIRDQAHRLVEEPFCVKVAGSVISPLNWPMMVSPRPSYFFSSLSSSSDFLPPAPSPALDV